MANAPSSSPAHIPAPLSIIETYSLIADGSINENNGNSLSPASNSSPRLSAFVVRLTDASLKALNQAIADAKQKKVKGGIVNGFVELGNRGNSTDGLFCFGGTSSTVHRFSLTDAQRDLGPKGQLDVVEQQQTTSIRDKFGSGKTNTSGRMKSIGPVTHRLQISATTEDTFELTKQKTQLASEEMRRTAAKVALKGPAGGGGATKVWQKINKTQASTSQRPLTPLSHQKASGYHKVTTNAQAAVNGNSGNGGDISKRPLRQRILYKLFINPMSAVELLSKLSSEGLSDSDRSSFDRTLTDVAQISRPSDFSTTNGGGDAFSIYEVKRSCYSEIRDNDWPFYNAIERQQCRKKLIQQKNPASQPHSNGGSNLNGANDNSDDTTRRVSGKISYRPPPKKPAANDSPKTVPSPKTVSIGGATVSPPMAAPALSSPPRLPPAKTASPVPVPATTNGSTNHSDDTTQRVSAKIGYRPPPKKPAAVSPLIGINGKSPPTAAAPLPSPKLAPSTTSPIPASLATSSAYSPPPPKKSRPDNEAVTNLATPALPPERPTPAAMTNGHHHEEDDTNLRRKKRQQHQRPALVNANNNHANTNGHHNHDVSNHVAPTPASVDTYNHNGYASESTLIIDYRNEYPSIKTADDRRRYKEDFDREYPVYLKLYDRLRITATEFEKLGDKLKRTAKNTSEYKDIEKEIVGKYHRFQKDDDMHRSRREHERLRKKLGAIKDRVKEYDDRQQIVLPALNGLHEW